MEDQSSKALTPPLQAELEPAEKVRTPRGASGPPPGCSHLFSVVQALLAAFDLLP